MEQLNSIRPTLTSVDEHGRAIDPARLLRGEHYDRVRDIFGLADSTRRYIGKNDLLEHGCNPSGLGGARRDEIGGYAESREFLARRARVALERVLAGTIGDLAGEAFGPSRRDADDSSPLRAARHVTPRKFGDQ